MPSVDYSLVNWSRYEILTLDRIPNILLLYLRISMFKSTEKDEIKEEMVRFQCRGCWCVVVKPDIKWHVEIDAHSAIKMTHNKNC